MAVQLKNMINILIKVINLTLKFRKFVFRSDLLIYPLSALLFIHSRAKTTPNISVKRTMKKNRKNSSTFSVTKARTKTNSNNPYVQRVLYCNFSMLSAYVCLINLSLICLHFFKIHFLSHTLHKLIAGKKRTFSLQNGFFVVSCWCAAGCSPQ